MAYPDNNPKTVQGLRKPSFDSIPPSALVHLGQAMRDGREKYGPMNWRESPVSISVYYNAALRHLFDFWDGEDSAADSGVHHLGHTMACCAIILDAMEQSTLNDDRPTPGRFPDVVARETAPDPAAVAAYQEMTDDEYEAHLLKLEGWSDEQATVEEVPQGFLTALVDFFGEEAMSAFYADKTSNEIEVSQEEPSRIPAGAVQVTEQEEGPGYGTIRLYDVPIRPGATMGDMREVAYQFLKGDLGHKNLAVHNQVCQHVGGFAKERYDLMQRIAFCFYLEARMAGVTLSLDELEEYLTRRISGDQ